MTGEMREMREMFAARAREFAAHAADMRAAGEHDSARYAEGKATAFTTAAATVTRFEMDAFAERDREMRRA